MAKVKSYFLHGAHPDHFSDFLSIVYPTPVTLSQIVMYSITAHDCKLREDRDISTVCQTESVISWGDSTCILQEFNVDQMKYYMKLFL